MTGVASVRTAELEEQVLAGLAEGEGLLAISKRLGIPRRTIRNWEERDSEFAARVRVARQHGYAVWADQILELSDAVLTAETTMAEVNAARLAVDSRKWLLSKLHPEQFGERVELTGRDGRGLFLANPEAAIPKLMAILAILLPGTGNSELHGLASQMAGKLKELEGPGKAGNGRED